MKKINAELAEAKMLIAKLKRNSLSKTICFRFLLDQIQGQYNNKSRMAAAPESKLKS